MRLLMIHSVDASPPLTKNPTVLGWVFSCPKPQCWRGFRRSPLGQATPPQVGSGSFPGVRASPFSAPLLSFQGPKSWIDPGLRAAGCGFRLVSTGDRTGDRRKKSRLMAAGRQGLRQRGLASSSPRCPCQHGVNLPRSKDVRFTSRRPSVMPSTRSGASCANR